MITSYKDLRVYNLSFDLTSEIFRVTERFPKEEIYALTDQVRRSSRSIPANIAEGFAKRAYKKVFKRHLTDAYGSSHETAAWLQVALDCGYIRKEECGELTQKCDEIARMLYSMLQTWK